MTVPATAPGPSGPQVAFRWLDALWIQVTGTLCNIACRHCFISCGPKAHQIPMMSRDEVRRALDEGVAFGMKQVYFTGGEPFLHPDLHELVEITLALAPLTIVTNGLLLDEPTVAWVSKTFREARYSFDLRVSLDGMTAAQNDPVRGRGTFERVVSSLRALGKAGLSPVVTIVEHEEGLEGVQARERFLSFVRELGIRQPRVKFLPLLRIGREPRRTHGYTEANPMDEGPLQPEVEGTLLCSSGRCVTAQGVFTCPILVEHAGARLGPTIASAARPIRLGFDACRTCVFDGLRCST